MSMSKKDDDKKLFAFLGIFLTVLGFIIVYAAKKNDEYAMFYAKQGLVLFLLWVLISLIGIIPVIGPIILVIGWILLVIAWVLGMVYSLSGEERNIPIIGQYAEMIKL